MKYFIFLFILFIADSNSVASSNKVPFLAAQNHYILAQLPSNDFNTHKIFYSDTHKPEKKGKPGIMAILLFFILSIAIGIAGFFLLSLLPISTILAIIGGLLIAVLCFLGIGLWAFSKINIC